MRGVDRVEHGRDPLLLLLRFRENVYKPGPLAAFFFLLGVRHNNPLLGATTSGLYLLAVVCPGPEPRRGYPIVIASECDF